MAIIGNGSIAKLLNDREGFVFFAAGISNSQAKRNIEESNREAKLLADHVMNANKKQLLMVVYFSTISIFYRNSDYTFHKRLMENQLKGTAVNYTIIRLGNIWECTNPNTFINAYKSNPYEPRYEYKYMIGKKQLNLITDNLPRTGQHEISIFGEMVLVKDVLKMMNIS